VKSIIKGGASPAGLGDQGAQAEPVAAPKEKPPRQKTRIGVQKTLKLYVGGEFVRSESGRTLKAKSRRGDTMHVSRASRKDLREAVEKMRAAQPGWWKRTAYNRGQILYRLAEMLDDRASAFPTSGRDVEAAADRAVHHAGWTDKVTALLSTLNPVAQTYVNYSMVTPVGVVVAVPRPEDGLLGLVEAICAPLVMGDVVTVIVPAEKAELAIALAEALATSDVPAGVVNLLTGDVAELVGAANGHDDVDALYVAGGAVDAALRKASEEEAARMMRRLLWVDDASAPATPHQLSKLAEVKTVWMSS
jgi:acyl-CoA reductase-like NAD-dependent aldehyde dehydrogenase